MPWPTTRKLENPAFMLGIEHSSPRSLTSVDCAVAESHQYAGQDVLAYSGRETPASVTWSHTELQKTQSSKTCPELHQATTKANLLPYVISREKSQAAS